MASGCRLEPEQTAHIGNMSAQHQPRALVLLDASVLLHPLMDQSRLLAELSRCNRRSQTAVVAAMAPQADERLQLGTFTQYRGSHTGWARTQEVLRAIHREDYDAVVLVGWWCDREAADAWTSRSSATVQILAGLDALDEVQLARACLGAAMAATDTLF